MKWLSIYEVKESGVYLCRLQVELIGNAWLSYIGKDVCGNLFLNDWNGEHKQHLICSGNKDLRLFGPIPNE